MHSPSAELCRPCVVRVLEFAAELAGEALALAGALGERAWQAPGDRVDEHQRGQLAAGEDVRPDRYGIGREVLDDALVKPLEAGGQQCQLRRARELLDELL